MMQITISLEWNDLLDEKADFEEEWRSDEDSDPDRELTFKFTKR